MIRVPLAPDIPRVAMEAMMSRPHRSSLTIALFLAACSSSVAPTGSTPPPAAPGAPASIAIVSGAGQSAAAGSVLPVTLSVMVTDGSGIAVPGVTVRFTVDSGGGALTVTSATTGSNGVASGGSWTLGSGAGITNVVTATVTGIATVKFHGTSFGIVARTLFSSASVSAGGTTLTYAKSGDPLNGLTLTVPAAAYTTTTQWTIVADSSVVVPLPAGFSQVGPVLVITNGQNYADSIMTLTMPMHLAAGMTVAPFYYDPVSGTLEGVPMVAQTATSATLATQHFSGDLMAIPGSGATAGSLRQSLRAGFGSVRVVWVQIDATKLVGTYSSTFTPGIDDWEFINYGDYIAPNGICEGMSITAMYYHYFFRLGTSPRAGLYHQFDQSLANQWDNVQGIRFAGSVQGDYLARWDQGINQVEMLTDIATANGTAATNLTSSWVLLTLKLTGRPVLIALQRSGGGHAVVAYAATSTGSTTLVSIANPNNPGVTTQTMTFINGVLQPIPIAVNAGEVPRNYVKAYALGVSTEVPLNQVATRWQEFVAGKAGSDRYPATYHFEILDSLTGTWSTLGSTFQTTAAQVAIRTICPSCPAKTVGGSDPDQQFGQIWDSAGQYLLAPGAVINGITTTTPYVGVMLASSPFGNSSSPGFVDYLPFIFNHGTFFIQPSTSTPTANLPVSFVTHHGGIATPSSTFTWNFGDNTAPVVKTGDSTVNHTFTTAGSYAVSVTLRDGSGNARGQASVTMNVQPGATFAISPALLDAIPGDVATMTATAHGALPAHVNYTWTFGDGFPSATVKDVTTVQHIWGPVGTFPVTLTVTDSLNFTVLGQATNTACIGTAWRLTAFNIQSNVAAGPDAPSDYVAALTALYVYLDQVAATPSDGLFYLGDGTFFPEQGVYFQVAAPGTGAAGACWLRAGYIAQAARVLGVNSSYTFSGTPTNGSINGAAYSNLPFLPITFGNTFNNTFTAGMGGRTMTGTVHFGSSLWGGGRTYNFTAALIGQ